MTVLKVKSKNGKFISTPDELFNRHCLKGQPDECWPWMAYRNESNYGQTRIGGRGSKAVLAHRLSWIVHFGEIPVGMHILHKCDNPPCCNPNHLFMGTNYDNILDRVKKGRSKPWLKNAPREKHPRSKIFSQELKEMIKMRESGGKVVEIARKFNISHEHCSLLINKAKRGELLWFS
jgi:hypothetical protein